METYSEKMKRKREEANLHKNQPNPAKKIKSTPIPSDKTVLILLGPPAIGKGTQSALLSERYSLHHISVGELLRTASERQDDYGQYIREHWNLKDLNEIAFQLLQAEIEKYAQDEKIKGFIIDGTPKTIDGVFQLNSLLQDLGLKIKSVLLMEIADLDVLSKRLKQRVDETAEKTRDDDTNEVLDIRLSNFCKQIELVQQYYEKLGILFKIDASHNKDVIFESISDIMDNIDDKIGLNKRRIEHEQELAQKTIIRQLKSDALNTDLVGELVQDPELWSKLLNTLLKCCRAKIWTFPGKIPVNMTKASLKSLNSNEWLVTSKANGTRYLLFIYQQQAYFINRKLEFYLAPQLDVASNQLYSIIDGEIVLENGTGDLENGTGDKRSRFQLLVNDALYLDGKFIGGMTFVDRMQRVKAVVSKIHAINGHDYPAIIAGTKKYFPIYQLKHVINGVIPQETIKNDGLIFAYKYGKYKLGKDESTLKWKPLDQCTADYVAKNRTVLKGKEKATKIRFDLFIQKGPQLVLSDEFIILKNDHVLFDQLEESMIVECQLIADADTKSGFRCVPNKIRADKAHPNADWVLESIKKTFFEWKDVDLNAIYRHFEL